MSLTPAASVILGNLKYDAQIIGVAVQLSLLPGVNSARITLPYGVRLEAAPGDEATLEMDGGEGVEKVMTGKVRSLQRGLPASEVLISDGGTDLSALRARATYSKQNGKDVIRALAGDGGADIGSIDIDLPLPFYAATQARTAQEHIAYLAELGGGIAHFDAGGALNVPVRPGSQADVALKYGREFLTYETTENAPPKARRVAVGSGPAGSPDAPEALRSSAGRLPEDAPDSGPEAVWRAEPVLRTPAAAKTATDAFNVAAAAASVTLRAECFLLPALRPGMVLEVQEMPEGPNVGPWLLTRVSHLLRPGVGGRTLLSGVSAGAGEGFDLLGAALSAAGSLL